jgi:hypothetical protein
MNVASLTVDLPLPRAAIADRLSIGPLGFESTSDRAAWDLANFGISPMGKMLDRPVTDRSISISRSANYKSGVQPDPITTPKSLAIP